MRRSWKLTAEQKRQVLRRYRTGECIAQIARDMGVGRNSIVELAHRAGVGRPGKRAPSRATAHADSDVAERNPGLQAGE